MAETTTVISCPECTKKFKGKSALVGKKIKCPFCTKPFTVPDPHVQAAEKAKEAAAAPQKQRIVFDDEDQTPGAYGVTDLDIRPRCPNCANLMASDDAFICLFCGYNTLTRTWGKTEKVIEHSGSDYFWHQFPAYLCLFFLVFQIIGILFYCLVLPYLVTPDSWMAYVDHESARMWTVIPALFDMWALGLVAYNRLIVNPTPPEKKKD